MGSLRLCGLFLKKKERGPVGHQNLIYLNERFVPEAEARVSVFDRGFLYGDGVFETLRAYGGRIFRLNEHMRRLEQSASLIGLRLPQADQLADVCRQLIERNGAEDAMLRMSVTRGPAVGGIGIARAGEPTIVAFVRPPMPLPSDAYTRGVSARIVAVRRNSSQALDARIKSMNFLNSILARAEAETAGAYEAILLNHSGHIAEASTANVFFATEKRLITPSADSDILPGITRAAVLDMAEAMGMPCEERGIKPSELSELRECFLTSSGVELLPVTEIDGGAVGAGAPGPVYERLHQAYRELVRRE
ncbi:MAG: branched-chain amino acid aminotransferase [Candidatus Abyssobacteria bacterium SURF_17]|uniref:branched-chain-amino-acid transaminase n=1 Tax=Candidatus Abyssobacteria bacterium SURF_17 TaxID=2093361 RepID=A0A419F3Z3_9BACT|nr:MAG: branched-chain amino acid aminotransferase [Candidatus Abyssubacteria bacterium SURF_17]